jgi:predicted DNA-binding transcriptional regulator YafY
VRAARLVSLLCLLQVREAMTGPELARELEVSERTVARDVLALAEAGVPVYAERGRDGGYRLLGGYRARLTGLHRDEAVALFLAGVPGIAAELGLGEAVETARHKSAAALAPPFRDAPDRVGGRFHLDAPRWFREVATPEVLAELSRAVWRDLRITAEYRRGERLVRRELEPHGLVLKAGVWYLVARRAGRFLTYRVDRFAAVEVGDEFARAEPFDLAEFWERTSAEFADSLLTDTVELRISPAGLRKLAATSDTNAVREAEAGGTTEPDGWIRTTLRVESHQVAHDQILGLGPEAEVLAPDSLRRDLAEAAERHASLYR